MYLETFMERGESFLILCLVGLWNKLKEDRGDNWNDKVVVGER
jgi:hypothetical protein